MATILLIEEDENIRLNVSEILTLAKYKVITVSNGKEGIETARTEHPDLIISDFQMPAMDGLGVLNDLKKDPGTKDTPFIFLTSKNEDGDPSQYINLGPDDFITKPFGGHDLLNAVENRIRRNEFISNGHGSGFLPVTDLNTSVNGSKAAAKSPLDLLIESSDIIEYKKKQVIYKEGSMPRFLYFIKSGKVKTFKSHKDGKDLVISLFGEGDFIGYALLLEGSYHIETAQTIEECEIVMIPKKRIEDLLTNNSQVTKKFMNLLAQNLMEKEQQVLGFAYNTLRKKVAEALISFEKKYHTHKDEKFSIVIGRNELASIAGTATESLIRTLTEFKEEKLIEMDKGIITIINESRLQHLLR
jgi:CRP/FNR family transcriptional regulator, cyclic AMP receptor protein